MKSTKGLTFYICFGSYGGFGINTDDLGFRVTLGFVSVAVVPRDIENLVHNIKDQADKIVEVWKNIPGYIRYKVSNYGVVKVLHRDEWKVLKGRSTGNGYWCVDMWENGSRKTISVHRLVMNVFCGNSDKYVDHINGNKLDNRLSNLRYCTVRENNSFRNHSDSSKVSSRYTGVTWNKCKNCWQSRIWLHGRMVHIGCFKDEIEASNAYQEKLKTIKP